MSDDNNRTVYQDAHGIVVKVNASPRPPWVSEDEVMPEPNTYDPMELFVAGAISTVPPFSKYHPAWAIPAAVKAVAAMQDWEPYTTLSFEPDPNG